MCKFAAERCGELKEKACLVDPEEIERGYLAKPKEHLMLRPAKVTKKN